MHVLAEREQVMELVQTLPDEKIHYVLNIIQSLSPNKAETSRCNLRGRFADYANPALRAMEKEAWSLAAEEKHGVR